jgi:hypothetical protein
MDFRHYFFKQKVTAPELRVGFEGAENADRNLVADDGVSGVRSGLTVVQHATPADLTVDVAAGTAYDPSGRRMRVPSLQVVNCAQDSNGVSTAVVNSGNSKIVGIFLKFARALSDDRTDGNGIPLSFVQNESFEIVRVQGAESSSPTAPATPADTIRLCDVTRTFGQTQILNANIATTNRKRAFDAVAGALEVHEGTTPAAIAALLTLLNGHVTGASAKHPASAIDYAAGGSWAGGTSPTNPSTTVQLQITKMIADLAALTAGASGAHRVGGSAINTAEVAAGPLATQLAAIATGWGKLDRANTWSAIQTHSVNTAFASTSSLFVLVWQGRLTSSADTTARVYLTEDDEIFITMNASYAPSKPALRIIIETGYITLQRFAGVGPFANNAWEHGFIQKKVLTLTNASQTVTVNADEYRLPTVTAARTYTLTDPIIDGQHVRFTKLGTGAFNITIERSGGTDLVVIPGGNDPYWVDLISDAGVWKVSAGGGLVGVFSTLNTDI